MRSLALLICLFTATLAHAASNTASLPGITLAEAFPPGASLDCRMMQDSYANYRRYASYLLAPPVPPIYTLPETFGTQANWSDDGADYAARALYADIHDIPPMFNHIGEPWMVGQLSRQLHDLDTLQWHYCHQTVR